MNSSTHGKFGFKNGGRGRLGDTSKILVTQKAKIKRNKLQKKKFKWPKNT
jgi:hypothetical protein